MKKKARNKAKAERIAVYEGFTVENGEVICTLPMYTRETIRFPDLHHPTENRKTCLWLVEGLNQFIENQPVAVRSWISAVYVKHFNKRLPEIAEKAKQEPDYNPNATIAKYMPTAKKYAEAEALRAAGDVQKAIAGWKVRPGALSRDEEREHEAKKLADEAIAISANYRGHTQYFNGLATMYNDLCRHAESYGIAPPEVPKKQGKMSVSRYIARIESAVLRLLNHKWYLKKLNRLASHIRENIYIATGIVNGKSPYVSKHGLSEWRESQRNAHDFLQSFILCNEEQDIEMLLADIADKTVSNPVIRRMELMVRTKGLQDVAKQAEMTGYFLTMTAPSAYHRNSGKRWNGSTPKETQAYLVEVFKIARAKMAKAGIEFKGIRTVEPHKDGTPHWHMIFFVSKERAKEALAILAAEFRREDAHELTSQQKRQYRFFPVWLDPKEGDAVSYVAKYVAKNIDPSVLSEKDNIDEEANMKATTSIERVNAWKTIHNIRQFQFFGTASVTLWRELRRIKDSIDNAEADAIVEACHRHEDVNGEVVSGASWGDFENLLATFPVILAKQESIAGQYKDPVRKIIGLIFGDDGEFVATREGKWEKKRAPARKIGADAPSCTRLNKCNRSRQRYTSPPVNGSPEPEKYQKVESVN